MKLAPIVILMSLLLPASLTGTLAQQAATPAALATPVALATPLPAGSTEYVDPAGQFTLPIPTGWTAATVGEAGVLTSPEGGITIAALAVPGDDIPRALEAAWQVVYPAFDLAPVQTVELPAMSGMGEMTVVTYGGGSPDIIVQAIAQEAGGVIYAVLLRARVDEAARRAAQLQTAALGLQVNGAAEASLLGVTPRKLTPAALAGVDAFMQSAMTRLRIPGAAYVVVQDGQIVHAAGFGVRELGEPAPVTPETLMLVGSTGKPMTTMYMATVVDAGRMAWDEPVVDIVPSFTLADPAISSQIRVRDLVCACTGVPRRDFELLFSWEGVTARDVIESLREFTLLTPVGEAFQYSNQMVATGGYVAAIADGGSLATVHEDYVAGMEEQIFGPIGMTATTFSFAEAAAADDIAAPHGQLLDGSHQPLPMAQEEWLIPLAPAAGPWSNVEDLGRFLIAQINQGVAPDGVRVVSAENLAETWAPGVEVAPAVTYGLGWMVSDYHGQPLLVHDGLTLGFSAELAFLPEAGIGVAVLTNAPIGGLLAQAVQARVLETAFDLPPEGDAIDFAVEQQEIAFAEAEAQLTDVDAGAVAPFLGSWQQPALGEVTLSLRGETLLLDAGEFDVELVPLAGGTPAETFYIGATPPMAGLQVLLGEEDGRRILVIHDPTRTEEFIFSQEGRAMATPVATPLATPLATPVA